MKYLFLYLVLFLPYLSLYAESIKLENGKTVQLEIPKNWRKVVGAKDIHVSFFSNDKVKDFIGFIPGEKMESSFKVMLSNSLKEAYVTKKREELTALGLTKVELLKYDLIKEGNQTYFSSEFSMYKNKDRWIDITEYRECGGIFYNIKAIFLDSAKRAEFGRKVLRGIKCK